MPHRLLSVVRRAANPLLTQAGVKFTPHDNIIDQDHNHNIIPHTYCCS
jgi:hypothetical protein